VPAWSLPGPAAQAVGVVLVVCGLGGAWLACADLVGGGYLRHVRGQLEMNHPPVAYEIALRARRMLPHDYRVARSLARIAIVKHDEALADEMLSVRLKLHPYLADAYADRADYDRENGRPDQAMARYEALLKQAPNFITAWVELAGLHVGRGEFGAAAEAYGRAEALQPHNSAWPYREAVFFALAGRFEEGVQAGARTEALDPGSGGLWEGLAVDRGLVVRRMREATRRVPGFATAWIILGQVAFERRDYRQAAQAFGEAVRLRPTVPIIRHNLAAAMGMLDRFREALAQDREAARLDPTFAEAWVGIALSAWVLRDLGTAQHAVGEALRLEPKNARALELRRRIEATASSRL
jgi:tetratricopeptide (TPR) repeat protein